MSTLASSVHQQYLDNLSFVIDHNYHWQEGSTVVVRLVTINTGETADTITDELAQQWSTRYTQFINSVSALQVGRGDKRTRLTRAQRHFLAQGLPVIELTGNQRIHLHLLTWELEGGSVFKSPVASIATKLKQLAAKHLSAVSINHGRPERLLTVVDGKPEFTWLGQVAVLKSTRYLRGPTSRRLYELLDPPKGQRQARKRKTIDQVIERKATGRWLIDVSQQVDLGGAVQITELDETSMMVTVVSTRTRTPYRRQPVLIRLLHELNLMGHTFSFSHPTFVANFDPARRLEQAVIMAQHGISATAKGFDPRMWCDRPGVFSTLYHHRDQQSCLRPIKDLLELMNERLFYDTYGLAERLFVPSRVWWSRGDSHSDLDDD